MESWWGSRKTSVLTPTWGRGPQWSNGDSVIALGTVGLLALIGVDASELLPDCWWSNELGCGKLQS